MTFTDSSYAACGILAQMSKSDLTGQRFGRRVVVSNNRVRRDGWSRSKVLCRCDCGELDFVDPRKLREGTSGMCLACARTSYNPLRKHGHTAPVTPEYRTWKNMIQRCTDPNGNRYHIYKDVDICDRWLGGDGFVNFLADMGPKPTPDHSIDRKDNAKGYSPENCRWATPKQQAQNRKNATKLTINGETKTLSEWADEAGVKYHTFRKRLKLGWTPEEALAGKRAGRVFRHCKDTIYLTVDGETKPVQEWSALTGQPADRIKQRVQRLGWSHKEAVYGKAT